MLLQLAAAATSGITTSQVLGAVAGAIPVVGGIVSTLINNHDTQENNEANEQFQLQQQATQDAYNTNMWNMQNDYNAPAAQMSRLEDAGLNPNLVYGSGNVTGNVAEAAPSMAKVEYVAQPMRAPDLAQDTTQGLSTYNNLTLGAAQTDNLKSSATLNTSTAQLQQTQAALNAANTTKVNQDVEFAPATQAATIANITSSTFKNNVDAQVAQTLAPLQASLLSNQADEASASAASTLSNAEQNAISTATSLSMATAQIAQFAVQNAKTAVEIANIKAATTLLLGNATFQSMDKTMRDKGIMPSDGPFSRAMGAIYNTITGESNAGSSSSPIPVGAFHPYTPSADGLLNYYNQTK